jgi:hypothetical protein
MFRKQLPAGGISCLLLILMLSASANAATTPEDDFAARCSAPGVVKCVGFNNTTSDLVRGVNLWPDGNGTYRASLDTSTKASGAGSLRFDLPPPPHAGANIAGSWLPATNDGLGHLFGQNSTLYVQFRQRLSPEMMTNHWDSSWKTVIFHYNQQSCGSLELTTVNWYLTGLATMYTDCGARGMTTTLDGSAWTDSTPLLMQQGDFHCQYGQADATTCLYFPTNEWLTFYYRIQIGTWDQPNSTIEAWVAREGSTTYKQFVRVPNFALRCNSDPCGQPPGSSEGYNNLTFTPYMTALSSSSGDAGVTSHVWYDDLIVSTQAIAAPGTGGVADRIAPAAPTGLRSQ